jgi:hypothetical protein
MVPSGSTPSAVPLSAHAAAAAEIVPSPPPTTNTSICFAAAIRPIAATASRPSASVVATS